MYDLLLTLTLLGAIMRSSVYHGLITYKSKSKLNGIEHSRIQRTRQQGL